MPYVESLDWLNLNSLRRYPIREAATVTSIDGLLDIPDTFIVDLSMTATNDVEERFHVSKIYNKYSSITVEISDSSAVVVGVFEVDSATHVLNKSYYLDPSVEYAGSAGVMVIAYLDELLKKPTGSYAFSLLATEFEPRTITPSVSGVTRITFQDDQGETNTFTGDVVLQAQSNLKFQFDEDNNRAILQAGDNLGLNRQCTLTNCVQSINGVRPDPETGDIGLIGIECLTISSPLTATLELSDNCCKPCSGCEELSELTSRLTSLENRFIELKNFYQMSNIQLTTYLATINSSCACDTE